MVTLTIDEITLNATRAALDVRVAHLEREITNLQRSQREWNGAHPDNEDQQRALVWNIAALHETQMAQEFYAEVEPGEDHPEDETWTNREGQPEFNGAFR